MTAPYTFYSDLTQEAPIPARGILSQTLSKEGDLEFVLFAFAAGEQARCRERQRTDARVQGCRSRQTAPVGQSRLAAGG